MGVGVPVTSPYFNLYNVHTITTIGSVSSLVEKCQNSVSQFSIWPCQVFDD